MHRHRYCSECDSAGIKGTAKIESALKVQSFAPKANASNTKTLFLHETVYVYRYLKTKARRLFINRGKALAETRRISFSELFEDGLRKQLGHD